MEAHMELALIILFWFALQFTLGVLFGKFIHFGMSEPQSTTARGKLQLVESLVCPVERRFCSARMASSNCE
jgi:hypothetical protein